MVRLKDLDLKGIVLLFLIFQFLNGSIKSPEGRYMQIMLRGFQFLNGSIKSNPLLSTLALVYFNSLMVRLKGGLQKGA